MQIQFTIQKFVTFVCINSRERTRQRATNSGDDFLVDALTKLDIVVGLTLRLLECAGLNNSVNFIFRLCVSCLVEPLMRECLAMTSDVLLDTSTFVSRASHLSQSRRGFSSGKTIINFDLRGKELENFRLNL